MPVLTAAENVELPLLLTRLPRAERVRRVEVALKLVGLQDRLDHTPRQLSGGQQQRVASRAPSSPTRGHRRRRAHRRPRPQERGGSAGAAPTLQRDPGQDGADGDARSACRGGRKVRAGSTRGSSRDARGPLGAQRLPAQQDPGFLTVLGVVITTVAFLFLRTVLTAWYASSEASSADRIVTRNAISLTQSLPLSYSDRIAQVPGVTRLTWSNWFGGIYKDRKNFFAQFAIDAPSALEVFDIRFVQGNKADFLGDRNACIVGKSLAEKFGWKVGDAVPLFSEIYRRLEVPHRGVIEGADDASIANTMYFHWARLKSGTASPTFQPNFSARLLPTMHALRSPRKSALFPCTNRNVEHLQRGGRVRWRTARRKFFRSL